MENKYQLSRIHNYIQGLMSREEMHALEREALDDPFLADALEGYKLQQGVDAKSLSLLQQRLERRVAAHTQQKNRFYFNGQRLAVGMAAAVLFVVGCTLLLIRYLPHQSQTHVTEVELIDKSLTQVEVLPLPGADAQPVGGWKAFAAFVAENYSGTPNSQHVKVVFQIDANGRPYNIQPQLEGKAPLYQDLIHLFQKGPKWEGKQGAVDVVFPE